MQYRISISVGVLILLLVGVGERGYAHRGTQVWAIPELTEASLAVLDLHDGSVVDWEEVVGQPVLTNADFGAVLGMYGSGPSDSADLSVRVFLGWHRASSRLYLAVERWDDSHINEYVGFRHYTGDARGFMWANDSINFMVDGDHSGGYYWFSDDSCDGPSLEEALKDGVIDRDELISIRHRYLSNRHAQAYSAIAEGPTDQLLAIVKFTPGDCDPDREWILGTELVGIGGGGSPLGSFYHSVIEGYVTLFDSLDTRGVEFSQLSHLAAGRIVGLQIEVIDVDQAPLQLAGVYSVEGVEPRYWTSADAFVDFVLVGAAQGVSAIASGSWAWLKATWQQGR